MYLYSSNVSERKAAEYLKKAHIRDIGHSGKFVQVNCTSERTEQKGWHTKQHCRSCNRQPRGQSSPEPPT